MYPELIEDLPHSTPLNKPGVVSVFAVPKDQVTAIRTLPFIMASTNPLAYPLAYFTIGFFGHYEWLSLAGGAAWLNISSDFACQLTFEEKEKQGVQLKTFQYKILFDLPNDDYATRGQIIQTFDRREWILWVVEVSGAQRLLGSMDRGADFSAALATGNAIKGPANKFTCGFTWECAPERAMYIKPGAAG